MVVSKPGLPGSFGRVGIMNIIAWFQHRIVQMPLPNIQVWYVGGAWKQD